MTNVALILLLIVIIGVVVILILLSVNTANEVKRAQQNATTIGVTDQCTRSNGELIDLTDVPCCCTSGFATDNRYVRKLNMVVGPNPVSYLGACAGFCANGSYNPETEQCNTGSSEQFTSCVNLTKPDNCKGSAMPVAVEGIQFYYVQSATDAACKLSSLCAPEPTNCVIPSTDL